MMQDTAHFRPKPLRIGKLLLDLPLVLAPMAGVTDSAYRALMADFGAAMVTTEMVSIQGLVRNQRATLDLCRQHHPVGVPLAVQVFGRDPAVMAEAARLVEQSGAALIDINAGCPVRKVVRQGAGAILLKDPDRLAAMVEAVKRAVSVPVTVKIRVGWDDAAKGVAGLARQLVSAGVDAITVHGRTAAQMYSGRADWSRIAEVKAAVAVPVIGNGDVTSPELAERMIHETGCDGVMIGRASLGNPWLFAVISRRWGRGARQGDCPGWNDFLRTAEAHLESFRTMRPRADGHLKKLLIWYSKGCPDSAGLRCRIAGPDGIENMLAAFRSWVHELMARGVPFLPFKVPEAGPTRN
ncbi:MAG TPA: tRNA dihydrouridine synthase DusB [Syntrophobacter fumaroxidans]|nr:tRNA dihydrouridine synthase DusB [Syntrophobacter fumaroxidans]